MACSDCLAARENPSHRVYSLGCIYCGARCFQGLKTWPAPRDMGGRPETTKERQEWRGQQLKDWAAHGHDVEALKALAAESRIPFEPVEANHGAEVQQVQSEGDAAGARRGRGVRKQVRGGGRGREAGAGRARKEGAAHA